MGQGESLGVGGPGDKQVGIIQQVCWKPQLTIAGGDQENYQCLWLGTQRIRSPPESPGPV